MKKMYFIAIFKKIRINDNEYLVYQKVSLSFESNYFETLEEAEQTLNRLGSKYVEYTILTEYYNTGA